MALSSGDKKRKKRLAEQTKTAKSARKPANKKAQKASAEEISALRPTDDTNINKMVELGLPIPPATKPEPKKKTPAIAAPKMEGPKEAPVKDTAPKTGDAYKSGNNEKNPRFEEVQKERSEAEIGKLGTEASVGEKQARESQLAKYEQQIREVPISSVPKNESVNEDALRPKMKPDEGIPTPAAQAKRGSGTARGGGGTGVYKFDEAVRTPEEGRSVGELAWRREKKGLQGLPGDENGVNSLALGLAKRDLAEAKKTGKSVNEMDPNTVEPSGIEDIYYGHHRRLAKVMLAGDISEDQIKNSAKGTGATFIGKVKYLHKLATDYASARQKNPIDVEKEGITHWVHPRTGVAHAISENHPDMPKTVDAEGGVTHGFWRSNGVEDRVRKDQNTGSWILDKRTGNSEVDSTLGWDPSKPQGHVVVNLRGGIKALKENMAPGNTRSLWHHEVNSMKNDFPSSVSEDSRLQHKTIATNIVDNVQQSAGADAPTRSKTPRMNSRSGKLVGIIRGTGRTRKLGFAVNAEGEAAPVTKVATSRARVYRGESKSSPVLGGTFPTRDFGGTGYSEGGSVLQTHTSEQPEMSKIIEYPAKKVIRKKQAITAQGNAVTVPPQRGALVQSRTILPTTEKKTRGQQWAEMGAPAPMWNRPNVIGTNEPGVSTAEPILKGRGTVTSSVMPDPRVAKKDPNTKKTVTKLAYNPGMVDQPLPGFETWTPEGKRPVKETPVSERVPTVSTQLAKITGNSPVEQPVENAAKTKKTVRVYGTKKMVPAPESPKKAEKIKANPEQLAFPGSYPAEGAEGPAIPGMEDVSSTHAGGQQWLKPRQLGSETLNLQGKAQSAGVPGGMSPTNVERGTEPAKSNRSFKNKR